MPPIEHVVMTGSATPFRLSRAAAEVLRITDRGNVAYVTSESDPTGAVYVERVSGRLLYEPATMWPPRWLPQLRQILTNMEE